MKKLKFKIDYNFNLKKIFLIINNSNNNTMTS